MSNTAVVDGIISVGDVAYFQTAGSRQAGEVILHVKIDKWEYTVVSVWKIVSNAKDIVGLMPQDTPQVLPTDQLQVPLVYSKSATPSQPSYALNPPAYRS